VFYLKILIGLKVKEQEVVKNIIDLIIKKRINQVKKEKKYPEKVKCKSRLGKLKAKEGNNLHHWSYNIEHAKDVIELSIADHNKIHRFLKYNQKTFMYKDLNGNLLYTREKHLEYINKILLNF